MHDCTVTLFHLNRRIYQIKLISPVKLFVGEIVLSMKLQVNKMLLLPTTTSLTAKSFDYNQLLLLLLLLLPLLLQLQVITTRQKFQLYPLQSGLSG